MTLFPLTCLLAILPVVSTKSPVFGPEEVSSVEGNSVSIRCYYPNTSVNRHARKYWCRQGANGYCKTLISSNGYVSEDYAGRANLTNFPEEAMFVMDIAQLTQHDSGSYKCGLGVTNRGLFFDVSLEVSQGPGLLNDTHVYTKDLGRTVTIECPFKPENAQSKKFLCKKTGQSCELVIDSNKNENPNYTGRINLSIKGTNKSMFTVTISHLKLSDAGTYVCQAGENSSADKKNIDLQVLEPEPELVYADLRSSVTFDCDLGTEVAKEAKYLCQLSNGTCRVIINTLEKRDPAFEGRILLTPKDNNGRFSVLITGLRKEDAGQYRCGAHSSGLPQEGWPVQAWQLFVNEETVIPQSRSVVKGVAGGSVAIRCPYSPAESSSLKYWCRWEGDGNGHCPLLVESQGLVKEEYEGRLALFEEPGNGTYTVILNQLTTQDAGFYWCLTNGDSRWRTTLELKVVEGEPSLKVPQNVTAVLGETLKISCHYPCKFYSYEKYWCKWSNKGCHFLPSQDEDSSQASTNCNSRLISMTLNSVNKTDEGWYWCGVKQGQYYEDTAAVYVAVEEKTAGSRHSDTPDINPVLEDRVAESNVRKTEKEVIQNPGIFAKESAVEDQGHDNEVDLNPRLFAKETVVEDVEQGHENRASVNAGSSDERGGHSQVLVSTLVPLGLVLTLGIVAVWVARVRHRKNVDRVSIRSYRTDISMSDFENAGDFGANDNMGASPVTQETILEGKHELMTTTESTVDPEESKKTKRSSKEEADMAYSAFLLQSRNIAAQVHDGPKEA